MDTLRRELLERARVVITAAEQSPLAQNPAVVAANEFVLMAMDTLRDAHRDRVEVLMQSLEGFIELHDRVFKEQSALHLHP